MITFVNEKTVLLFTTYFLYLTDILFNKSMYQSGNSILFEFINSYFLISRKRDGFFGQGHFIEIRIDYLVRKYVLHVPADTTNQRFFAGSQHSLKVC